MAAIVGRLLTALLQGDELVAQVDEGHGVALTAQFEVEEAAIERQRLFDIPHFQRHMVEANEARFCQFSHRILLCLKFRWVGPVEDAIAIAGMVMSSVIPSVKYSCSGSPDMFVNGSTAIEEL